MKYHNTIKNAAIRQPELIDEVVLAEGTRFECKVARNDGYDNWFEKAVVEELLRLKAENKELNQKLESLAAKSGGYME